MRQKTCGSRRPALHAGTAAQYDVLTAQVTLANDQQALEARTNQLNIDRANLNNLLGIDPNVADHIASAARCRR